MKACAALVALAVMVAPAADAEPEGARAPLPSAREVKERWQGRLDGLHFTARVRLAIERSGQREERLIEVWRDDAEGQRERLMARFEAPAGLRGLGLLYLENPGSANDYFLYQPATRRVRRVPHALAREDVYGIDLEYLGFGVAQIEPARAEGVDLDLVAGHPALRLREHALRPNPRFESRTVWLDPESFVPLRTRHERGERTTLLAHTEILEEVQGVATPLSVVFERQGERISMNVERIDYREPIPGAFFSTLNLLKR
jgi:hypothetical protein